VHEYENVIRWNKQVSQRPAYKRGAMVNKAFGPLEGQLRERHSAADFDTNTQDKIEAMKS
jgi:GST-like protein